MKNDYLLTLNVRERIRGNRADNLSAGREAVAKFETELTESELDVDLNTGMAMLRTVIVNCDEPTFQQLLKFNSVDGGCQNYGESTYYEN